MTRGLVIGKFYPPHNGHSYLIDYALERSDEVTVLVCDSPSYTIPAAIRQRWLQSIHPKANVRIIPDLDDDDNSRAWAEHTLQFLGYTPDAVFSSETYGMAYAKYMDTEHHMVDQKRLHVPISATRIRHHRINEWQYLDTSIRADLAIRIVIVGAESTGTTTLSRDIAKALNVLWVPEYGRTYSEGIIHTKYVWSDDDFVHIAKTQQSIERQLACHSDGIIICDTNATATTIWQERYMGTATREVHDIALNDHVDYYIITGDEIPFVQDGVRDGEHVRHDMHDRFVEYIEQTGVPFSIVRGDKRERLQQALAIVQNLDITI